MLFTSLAFVAFYVIVLAAFSMLKTGPQQTVLLTLASFVFYAWNNPVLLALLFLSILTNAVVSFRVAEASTRNQMRAWAIGGVAFNLFVLGLFKYDVLLAEFFRGLVGVDSTMGRDRALVSLPLPIGISFYTFEGISLVVDVFRGHDKTNPKPVTSYVLQEKGLLDHIRSTALFVAFFPHLIAGPVLKAATFFPQISHHRLRDVRWNIVVARLIEGYFLKMVIADNLHDQTIWIAYPYFEIQSPLTNVVLLFGYSIQIFADFAGYSLIAIGLGESFGYRLMTNFDFPYISRSIAEFWRRWHISLSTWLLNYLYFPLGGNRRGHLRTYLNLMVVMVLGGMWHGAAWSYAVWGAFHGAGLVVERFIGNALDDGRTYRVPPNNIFSSLLSAVQMLLVFFFVSIGWVLFKLPDLTQAIAFFRAIATGFDIAHNPKLITTILLYSIPVVAYHARHLLTEQGGYVAAKVRRANGVLYGLMLVALVLNSGSTQAFIYFQF